MKNLHPNLFASLFDFHPRGDHTPRENFLTESLAYLLRTDETVRVALLSRLLGRELESVACESIETRRTETHPDSDTPVYPDLVIDGRLLDGEKFEVFCEHKWDAPCNQQQLTKYRKVAARRGPHSRLAFIGATCKQRSEALKCFEDNACVCLLWEDVYTTFDRLPVKTPLLREFLDFMKFQGLSPGKPVTVERMVAFLQSADFVQSLLHMANKLWTNYPWDVIPKRYHAETYVHDAYGRVGIRFETKNWRPALSVGFLYDEADHRVSFVNRTKGIDLMLRLEAEPKHTKNIQPVVDDLNAKRKTLQATAASILLKDERGNGNKYSVLIVRDCLGDVIANTGSEDDQLAAIHQRLSSWLGVLFNDGTLEVALQKTGLDSGMK